MAGARSFTVGDRVHVASIGKGVVREVRNGGRYLVEVKGRHILVAEGQLSAEEGRKQRSGGTEPPPVQQQSEMTTRSHAAASIDLHGFTTDEAVVALDAFLSDAILAGIPEVRVIHGRSGGRVKATVHARLKVVTSVRSFRVDPSNPGVTLVTL